MQTKYALVILCALIALSGCTRFYETEPLHESLRTEEAKEKSPFYDAEARAHNERAENDPRPYGGIFGESWAH